MAGLRVPLSTPHPRPHGRRRMTRGQDGSLDLSCAALASATPCRFIPALSWCPRNPAPRIQLGNSTTFLLLFQVVNHAVVRFDKTILCKRKCMEFTGTVSQVIHYVAAAGVRAPKDAHEVGARGTRFESPCNNLPARIR